MRLGLQKLRHRYEPAATDRAALVIDALTVEAGAAVCLVGSSGSGKTTLLNILAGVLVPSSGQVQIAEQDLFALSEMERDRFRARHIGCVFQTLNLLQGLSVLENLTLAQRFAGIGAAEARRKGLALLEQLGLGERARSRPAELSLGEQQRVAIARAVCKSPGLVLADEPTASLDDQNAEAALELLVQSCRDSTLIVASHDARLIGRFERVVSLAQLASLARTESTCERIN